MGVGDPFPFAEFLVEFSDFMPPARWWAAA